MGCNALALLRCNRIGCPSETITPYCPLSIAEAFVPPSLKRHSILSRFSLKANRFYTPPLLGTNASKKRRSRIFSSWSVVGTKFKGIPNDSSLLHQSKSGSFIKRRYFVSTRPNTECFSFTPLALVPLNTHLKASLKDDRRTFLQKVPVGLLALIQVEETGLNGEDSP